jgi:hypothetical protein
MVVYDESGREIYVARYLSADEVVDHGTCDYLDIETFDCLISRAGKHPLIAKAIATRDNDRIIVVSDADGQRIYFASGHSDFLKRAAVVVLAGPQSAADSLKATDSINSEAGNSADKNSK